MGFELKIPSLFNPTQFTLITTNWAKFPTLHKIFHQSFKKLISIQPNCQKLPSWANQTVKSTHICLFCAGRNYLIWWWWIAFHSRFTKI